MTFQINSEYLPKEC